MIETTDMSIVALSASEAVSLILGALFWGALLCAWLT
jgi:hypothetical protein